MSNNLGILEVDYTRLLNGRWDKDNKDSEFVPRPIRSCSAMLSLLSLVMLSCWGVFHLQHQSLPEPLTPEQAGMKGFSEIEAMKHVKALAELGPHPVGSETLEIAVKYVVEVAEKIKSTSHSEVEVEVDQFYVKSGANYGVLGREVAGTTFIYGDLNYIVMRVTPRNASQAKDNSILVSSHIDTAVTTGGAGDCSSCVGVMLEVARAVSQWDHGFKSSIIFLFNVGEEDGYNGAHSFITQHPWSQTIRLAIDLKAMGNGGRSSIFQAGPHPWAVEKFSKVAKYPSGDVILQDLFSFGIINSSTDFQIYNEVAGLSGLDFAYLDNTAVYHTKNDKLELIRPGSLQHLGENLLPFLIQTATSPALENDKVFKPHDTTEHESAIYFDILGSYMIVYGSQLAKMLHNSVIMLAGLISFVSLLMGGNRAVVLLALSCISVILMWVFSLSFSVPVAYVIQFISSSAVPYVGSPWLVIGLFGFPALVGAMIGQHLGFILLEVYLCQAYVNTRAYLYRPDLPRIDAERWLFKSGLLQWLGILMVAHYFELRSTYIALTWLVIPAFAYGLLEKTLSPTWSPYPLKIVTLLTALSVPIMVSAGAIIRVINVIIQGLVRIDRNPGAYPAWQINVIVAVIVTAFVCLMMVYLLSYVHLSGAKLAITLVSFLLFGLSLMAIRTGTVPPYNEITSRSLNVVHVVDMGVNRNVDELKSYISLFSSTPGKLTKEVEEIKEGFECRGDKDLDYVTFSVKYGCLTYNDTGSGWSQREIPELQINSDRMMDSRVTEISIDTKISKRWSLAINADKITDFEIKVTGDSEKLVSLGNKNSVDGKHIVQFSGGRNATTKFDVTLFWARNSTPLYGQLGENKAKYLMMLRADVNKMTPKVEKVLRKLPSWSALFGHSTAPYIFAYFTGLPIDL